VLVNLYEYKLATNYRYHQGQESMQKLIIFGAGKIAKILYHYLKNTFDIWGFTVDRSYIETDRIFELPVVPFEEISEIYPPSECKMVVAIGYHGMNKVREQKYQEAKNKGYEFISYVDDHVKKFDDVAIGENCIVLDNTTIQPFAEIGNNTIIWSNVTIAHGVKIGDNCWIASGAVVAGDASVQSNCFIGINASVGHNVTIGRANYIGANAQVCRNTDPDGVYIAEQATKFRLKSDQFIHFAQL
jgi:sugar O-acyltransferase (sialic acid O-acetyltransferase NeuD family)